LIENNKAKKTTTYDILKIIKYCKIKIISRFKTIETEIKNLKYSISKHNQFQNFIRQKTTLVKV